MYNIDSSVLLWITDPFFLVFAGITLSHIQESPATQERIEAFWKLDPSIRTYPQKSKDPVEVSSTSYTMSSDGKSSKAASRFSVSDLQEYADSRSQKRSCQQA
ncbi:hypothetical protein Hanom_Chr02g00118911 [Helianthus anomalus]